MTQGAQAGTSRVAFSKRGHDLTIVGRPLFGGDSDDLLRRIASGVDEREPRLLITLNVDQTLTLQDRKDFRRLVADAWLVIIDGMPIAWLARSLRTRGRRNTGADLLPQVVARAAEHGWRVALTGGSNSALESAVDELSQRFKYDQVFGVPFPRIASATDEIGNSVVERLRELQPNVVFLCLGSPKQELWFAAQSHHLPPAVYIGAGAAVDFAAGTARRAPLWLQRLGLEWVFRLASEPSRLAHRYLIRGPRFLGVILRSFQATRNA